MYFLHNFQAIHLKSIFVFPYHGYPSNYILTEDVLLNAIVRSTEHPPQS